jgi:hypothetical protein|eukprot:COSAG06_NODE_8900_length_2037_cov_3.386997_3_plen_177_part_00
MAEDDEPFENPIVEPDTFDKEESGPSKRKGKKKGKKKGGGKISAVTEHRLANRDDRGRETRVGEVAWTNDPRKCQDCCFCFVMVAYALVMVVIYHHAATTGDWRRLLVPQDRNGMSCGMDNGVPGGNLWVPASASSLFHWWSASACVCVATEILTPLRVFPVPPFPQCELPPALLC